jgi:CRISPR-associated endonuclease/helicase Cas3
VSLSTDDFREFFAAVHGDDAIRPYTWQRRLLSALAADAGWPDTLAAPTGAGKTAVIDVHVFALALMAQGTAPRLPRRLCMVVDRRALVDDQYEHALDVCRLLETSGKRVVREVAQALRGLRTPGGDQTAPLIVSRLRGGVPTSSGWLDDPAACQILCATPDMWGSRLLFGAYGSHHLAWPREAGLLAFDSVVIVDEGHLSRQLIYSARRVAQLARVGDDVPPVPVLQVVSTTATPDDSNGTTVTVEPADLDDSPDLRARLCAPKPITLLELPTWPLPRTGPARREGIRLLAGQARDLRSTYGPTVGCFVNNVGTAADLAAELGKDATAVLVCGRMRSYDLDQIRARHSGLFSVKGDTSVDFLISTQTLEVGADLDWTAALTELAPGTVIAQRAGRVNRRGKRSKAEIVVAVPSRPLDGKAAVAPYAVPDLTAAMTWLRERADHPSGLAPWVLRNQPAPAQRPRRTLLQRPELADAWLLARTSDRLFARPELDLWLSDDLAADLDIGIVVRHDLPPYLPDAIELVRATPPRDYESIPVRLTTARRRLSEFAEVSEREPHAFPVPLVLRGADVFGLAPNDLRPGDLVVIDDRIGIFTVTEGVAIVTAEGTDRTTDVLEAPSAPNPRDVIVRIGQGGILDSPPDKARTEAVFDLLADVEEMDEKALDSRAGHEHVAVLIEKLIPHVPPPSIARFDIARNLLRRRVKDSVVTVHRDAEGRAVRLIVAATGSAAADERARQRWTPADRPVTLVDHSDSVARRARLLGESLGLGRLTAVLERAGLHHDDGKRDGRFQASIDPEHNRTEALAKSGMDNLRQIRQARAASGLPTGWRHEQLSVLSCRPHLADLPEADQALAARLVGTSHGHGRHSFPHTAADLLPNGADDDLAVRLFDEGEWDHHIDHTHHVYGVWGCAYLEAVLRAADGQVSGEGS